MTEQLALATIIDQLPVSADQPLAPVVLDPRDIPLPSDLIDTWSAAAGMWMMRWTNRNKRGKSPETIKVHARSWFDFFTCQLPSRPVLTGLDRLARRIAAGDEAAMLHLSRQIRAVITECYTQSRIAQYTGRPTGIKPPWEIDTTDVMRWELDLEQRSYTTTTLQRGPRKSKKNPLGGNKRVEMTKPLSSESIAQRMAALSSFYIYVSEKHILTHSDGGVRPLGHLNPVKPLPRHEVYQYGKAIALDGEQVSQLLRTVRSNHSLTGLRDFALFSAYLYLGRRNSEIRELTWGDILDNGKQYRTRTKGKKDHYEKADLPKPVYSAITRYLQAADRLDGIQPGDPIFIAHSDRARHLKTRDGASVVAEDYAPGSSPISGREVGRCLKKYARKAGLEESQVHVHVLRHSAAMLRKEVGDRLEDISQMLGHANYNTTKIYLDHMDGHKDVSWRKVEALIGLDPDDDSPLPPVSA
jgi:site-specific recombinase XerD